MDFHNFDCIIINSSAGKDSQAMLDYVVELADQQGYYRKNLIVVHCDLGRVEWQGTKELAREQAECYGLRFEVVARKQDLLDHIEQRGMFPSSTTRYCTSDHKRGQAGKVITMMSREVQGFRGSRRHVQILNCMGFRSQESPARAAKPQIEINERASCNSRTVTQWLPIHDWNEEQVWERIRQSGVRHHYAYDLGMPRLSCCFCIFAPKAALILAGKANPELLDQYVQVEKKINHTFRKDLALAEIQEAILAGEVGGEMDGKWNM